MKDPAILVGGLVIGLIHVYALWATTKIEVLSVRDRMAKTAVVFCLIFGLFAAFIYAPTVAGYIELP